MSDKEIVKVLDSSIIEKVIVEGDLSKLSSSERVSYYNRVCSDLGLNPYTKPFEYIKLNNKLTLYALKSATDQLRQLYNVSIVIKAREVVNECYVVTAGASLPTGRVDESIGAVNIKGLAGDMLCNCIMKAETKAKRRVTLSICGLSMLDETEIETIPKGAVQKFEEPPTVEQAISTTQKHFEGAEVVDTSKSKVNAIKAIENAKTVQDIENIIDKLNKTVLTDIDRLDVERLLSEKLRSIS
jgi:hypothetical protein